MLRVKPRTPSTLGQGAVPLSKPSSFSPCTFKDSIKKIKQQATELKFKEILEIVW